MYRAERTDSTLTQQFVTRDKSSQIVSMRTLYGHICRLSVSLAFLSFITTKSQQVNDPQQSGNSAGIRLVLKATPDLVQSGMPAELDVILFVNEHDPMQTFDGQISFILNRVEYNWTLLDKRVFETRRDIFTLSIIANKCHTQADIPSDIVATAFSSIKLVDPIPRDIDNCPDTSKRIQIVFANMPYLMCPSPNVVLVDPASSTSESKIIFLRAHGDILLSRDVLNRPQNMPIAECSPIPNLSLDFAEEMSPIIDPEPVHIDDKNGCQCPETRLPCLFVHGINVHEDEKPGGPFYYWRSDKVEEHCCSTIRFVHSDSFSRPWYDDALARRFCDAALELAPSADPMSIEKIVVVAHSAGNLIVANAEVLKICALAPTSKWIALAAPMRGSFFADRGMSICAGKTTSNVKISRAISHYFEKHRQCPLPQSMAALVTKGSIYSKPNLDQAYENAERVYMAKVSSILCGDSHVGLMSKRAAIYTLLSVLTTNVSEKNDGSISFSSCRAGFQDIDFTTTWKNTRHYLARLNHGDTKIVGIRNGWWGDDRKPLKWFKCQF